MHFPGKDEERTVTIVGVDELDPDKGRVSWISPIAKVFLNARVGDVVTLRAPKGTTQLEIVEVRYDELD
jgi:transcription elongation factor GreB